MLKPYLFTPPLPSTFSFCGFNFTVSETALLEGIFFLQPLSVTFYLNDNDRKIIAAINGLIIGISLSICG